MNEINDNSRIGLDRLAALFDDSAFTEIDAFAKSADGEIEVSAGFGTIEGIPVYAFSQEPSVSGGAISAAQCAKIKKIYDLAAKTGCPIIGIYDSNGVKLSEGFEALTAYGEIVKASASVSGVIPQISVIAGACLGTSALVANMADVVIAVKDADFYVTTPSDITARDSAEQGTVDIVADDFSGAAQKVRDIISLLPSNNLDFAPVFDCTELPAADLTQLSGMDFINAVASNSVELKKDYAANVVTALGVIGGIPAGIIAFGGEALCPACIYKAEAFVKFCDAFNMPIVTIVDSNGFARDNENPMLVAVTKLTSAYASATCPKISLITGNAVGAAYITLAGRASNADLAFAWDTAVVSPLEPESAVAFLFSERLAEGENREELEREYKETLASPFTAAASGAIDDVFVPEETTAKLISALNILSGKRETTIPRKHSVK